MLVPLSTQIVADDPIEERQIAKEKYSSYKRPGVEQPKETTEIEQVLEEVPVHEHKELVPVDKAINKAIKLLTENGYRVSKPVLIYEEVTVK